MTFKQNLSSNRRIFCLGLSLWISVLGVSTLQAQKITTVAGNGMAGFSGDGGPAGGASLNGPVGVAVAGAGNFFIADQSNHCIRLVAPAQ